MYASRDMLQVLFKVPDLHLHSLVSKPVWKISTLVSPNLYCFIQPWNVLFAENYYK